MTIPFALLGLLERAPSYGYELKQEYDSHLGRGRPLAFGQVYATLGRLARDGKVSVGVAERGAGPDRRRYSITGIGQAEFDAWIIEPAEPEPHLQTVLFMKVVLALLGGRPAHTYLDAQRAAHLQRMRELTATKTSATLLESLLADHALFRLEADLRWIDLTEARLVALARELQK
jgi:DNA-binding PadR family transcriptional regulator